MNNYPARIKAKITPAFFFLFLSLTLKVAAQDTTITLYFDSGQSSLKPAQQKSIDQLQRKSVAKIVVDGYADTVGKASFNKKLSYNRAKTAASTITAKSAIVEGKGESQEKRSSLKKMRKVVVKVWYEKEPEVPRIPAVKKDTIAPVDLCKDDTTIVVGSGTTIKMNRCFYNKVRNCFSYREYLDARSVQQAGLRTIDERGNPIESGGMIDIGFCADTCLRMPVIIFLRVPKCLSRQQMTLWTITRENTWRNSKNKIEFVKINGEEFYKMEIYCPGRINCDKPTKKNKKVKIKLKNGLRPVSAALSYDCPIYSVSGKVRKKERKVVFPYVCPGTDPLLYLKAVSREGDTLLINNENVNQFKRKRRVSSSCLCKEKPKERYLGVFRIRQKYLYKKYKIYSSDFIQKRGIEPRGL